MHSFCEFHMFQYLVVYCFATTCLLTLYLYILSYLQCLHWYMVYQFSLGFIMSFCFTLIGCCCCWWWWWWWEVHFFKVYAAAADDDEKSISLKFMLLMMMMIMRSVFLKRLCCCWWEVCFFTEAADDVRVFLYCCCCFTIDEFKWNETGQTGLIWKF